MQIPSRALKKISSSKTELGGDSNVHFSQNHNHDSTGRLNWKSQHLKSLGILEGKYNPVRIANWSSRS